MTPRPPSLPDLPMGTLAVGWATVELDRAAVELAGLLHDGTTFAEAARSPGLGASCRAGRAAAGESALRILLLEPDTEGRLAAFLARFGEGWVATWALATSAVDVEAAASQPGPLGPERLDSGASAGDPFRFLVTAATIEP